MSDVMPQDGLRVLRAAARRWRERHPEHAAGVVLIWENDAYGWKDKLRDASHECPGAIAVDEDGNVFVAEGGDQYNGAKVWAVVR